MVHASHVASLRRAFVVLGLMLIGFLVVFSLPPNPFFRGMSGYVPLHLFLEVSSIVIACLVFAIGWNAYSRERPGTVALLASLFLGVALLDFSHALSFKGMPDFITPSHPEKAINFWLVARLLAALALLTAVLAPWRPHASPRTRYFLLAGSLGFVALANWIFLFHGELMPRTFIDGQGLTPVKIAAEYLIISISIAAAILLWWRMKSPLPFNAPSLFGAICAMALSELCFTLYVDVTDVFNLLGHLYKAVSYLFLYRAIFIETVESPFRQLDQAKTRLQEIQRAIPDLLWLKDDDGVYLDCNPSFERFFGTGKAGIIGKTDYDFVPRELADSFRANDKKAIESGRPSVNEESISFADSKEQHRLVETIKTPIYDSSGALIGILGISRDITERAELARQLKKANRTLDARVKRRTAALQETNTQLAEALKKFQLAQDELVQSEKMAALGGMVAGIAHELNTPIGNTLITASALKDQTAELVNGYAQRGLRKTDFEHYLENASMASDLIMHSLNRASELITSFKQVAVDQQSSMRRQFRLGEQISEIVLALSPSLKQKKVRVAVEVPEGIMLDSFPGPLGQVLMNLINNAMIHAYGDKVENGQILIKALQSEPDWVEIQVEDFGAGIAPENLNRIFDPFFTTRFGSGGNGLGLSIVHNLVTQVLEGKITVESELGKGTRFVLILPLVPSHSA